MHRVMVFLVSISMLIALVYGSLSPPGGEQVFPHLDKLVHILAYMVFCGWHRMVFPGHGMQVLLASLALGAVLEILQGMTGYRDASIYDILANAIGCLCGLALARLSGIQLLRHGAAVT